MTDLAPTSTATPGSAPAPGSSPAKKPRSAKQLAYDQKLREQFAAGRLFGGKARNRPASTGRPPLPVTAPTQAPGPSPSAPPASSATEPAPSGDSPKKGRFLFFDIDPPKLPGSGGVATGDPSKPKGFFDRLGF